MKTVLITIHSVVKERLIRGHEDSIDDDTERGEEGLIRGHEASIDDDTQRGEGGVDPRP